MSHICTASKIVQSRLNIRHIGILNPNNRKQKEEKGRKRCRVPGIKLVRNAFGTLKVIKDMNGDTINWCYIEELLKLQEQEGLHLCNKLRRAHVEWESNKI